MARRSPQVRWPDWILKTKPAASETVALGGLWASLLDLALVMIALAFAVNAYAPPQDLPWKPLRLEHPPGLATAAKLRAAAADPALCRQVLTEGGVDFADQPDRRDGDCPLTDTLRLEGGVTPLSPAGPVMTCPLALGYAFWDRHVLRPGAEASAEAQVARVEHYGVFACRNIYGRAEGRRSEHAAANALDVSAIVLTDGRSFSVQSDFRDADEGGVLLRAARTGACDYFSAVLSPDYNQAHADHLHLDLGPYRVCR